MAVKVGASLLSANFLELGKELHKAETLGCDLIHIDVMDGSFVNNIAIGKCVMKWLRLGTSLRLDAHLAVHRPLSFVDMFADIPIDAILFHPESCVHHRELIERIRRTNKLVGVALLPAFDLSSIEHLLPELDIVNQLAVNPGFPSQAYNSSANINLKRLKQLKNRHGYAYEIQVDGGISLSTAGMAVEAGAETLVSGSSLFKSDDMGGFIARLKNC